MTRRRRPILASAALLLAGAFALDRSRPTPAVAQPPPESPPESSPAGRIVFPSGKLPKLPLPGGARPIRSLLDVREQMKYGDFVWNDARVPPGRVWIRVDLGQQTMSVFRGQHEIGTAVILYGADEKPTPLGRFPVMARYKNHRSSLYDAPMPYTLRLTGDGVAIHGSNVRWGAATHGCIGVPTAFAAKLFPHVRVGDPVMIVSGRSGAGPVR